MPRGKRISLVSERIAQRTQNNGTVSVCWKCNTFRADHRLMESSRAESTTKVRQCVPSSPQLPSSRFTSLPSNDILYEYLTLHIPQHSADNTFSVPFVLAAVKWCVWCFLLSVRRAKKRHNGCMVQNVFDNSGSEGLEDCDPRRNFWSITLLREFDPAESLILWLKTNVRRISTKVVTEVAQLKSSD